MNTHPDVLWVLVKDHQARLLQEAEHESRAHLVALARAEDAAGSGRAAGAGRTRRVRRWFGQPTARRSAGTLAACGPGAAG
jgi:hypothetical protein